MKKRSLWMMLGSIGCALVLVTSVILFAVLSKKPQAYVPTESTALFNTDGSINGQTAANILRDVNDTTAHGANGYRLNYFRLFPDYGAGDTLSLSQSFWRIANVNGDKIAMYAVTPYRNSAFDTTTGQDDYSISTVRTNLNNDFNAIPIAIRNNITAIGSIPDSASFSQDFSSDKIWLPSYDELNTTWGFGTTSVTPTSYSYRSYNPNGFSSGAWLRSPYTSTPGDARFVSSFGAVGDSITVTTSNAVRPALYLSKSSLATASSLNTAEAQSLFDASGNVTNMAGAVGQLVTAGDKRTPFRLFPEVTTANGNVTTLSRTLWRVAKVDVPGDRVTLYAETGYRSSQFDSTTGQDDYSISTIRTNLTNDFSSLCGLVPGLSSKFQTVGTTPDSASFSTSFSSDLIFLPSYDDLKQNGNYGYTAADGISNNQRSFNPGYTVSGTSSFSTYAWLRSPYTSTPGYARRVNSGGAVNNSNTVTSSYAVRPALHLTLSSLAQSASIHASITGTASESNVSSTEPGGTAAKSITIDPAAVGATTLTFDASTGHKINSITIGGTNITSNIHANSVAAGLASNDVEIAGLEYKAWYADGGQRVIMELYDVTVYVNIAATTEEFLPNFTVSINSFDILGTQTPGGVVRINNMDFADGQYFFDAKASNNTVEVFAADWTYISVIRINGVEVFRQDKFSSSMSLQSSWVKSSVYRVTEGELGNSVEVVFVRRPNIWAIVYDPGPGKTPETNLTTYSSHTPNTEYTPAPPILPGYFGHWTPHSIPRASSGDIKFIAGYNEATFDIVYNLNGGTIAGSPPLTVSGVQYGVGTLTYAAPTKAGYKFSHWSWGAERYAANSLISTPYTTIANATFTVTLTAEYETEPEIPFVPGGPYRVTYVLGDQTWYSDIAFDAPYSAGVPNAMIETAVEGGVTYGIWWYTEPDGGGVRKQPGDSSGNTDHTLYGVWIRPATDVTFDDNGGAGGPGTAAVEYGLFAPNLASLPTRAGATFAGYWTTASGAGTQYYFADGSSARYWDIYNANPSLNVATLYARWEVVLTLHANGGLGGYTETFFIGENPPASITPPTREHYTFDGFWDADFITQYYDADGDIVGSWTITENTTLYAKWAITGTYDITFHGEGGAVPAGGAVSYQQIGLNCGEFSILMPNAFTRSNYTFLGWLTEEGEFFSDESYVTSLITGDFHLYAMWSKDAPTIWNITYVDPYNAVPNSNPATYEEGVGVPQLWSLPNIPNLWIFDGWYDNPGLSGSPVTSIGTGATGHKTLYAKWRADEPAVYDITYNDPQGASNPNALTYTYGVGTTLQNLSKTDYTFDGWFDASVGGNKVTSIGTAEWGDKEFWARWTAITYNITYSDWDFGTTSNPNVKTTYTIEDAMFTPAAVTGTRTGYTFTGWSPSSIVGGSTTGAVEFVAQWSLDPYTITYNRNGASWDGGYTAPTGFNIESSTVTLPTAADMVYAGFVFGGWFDNIGLIGSAITEIATGTHVNQEFWAKWDADSGIVVTFNANGGGTPSPQSITVTFESAYGTLATVSRNGYTFAGWWTLQSGGDEVTDLTEVDNPASHTLWAHWTVIPYSITYGNWDFGMTGNPNVKATYTIEDLIFTPAAVTGTRTGYTFAGWSPASISAGSWGSTVNFVAQWTPIAYGITFNRNGGSWDLEYTAPANFNIESLTITLPGVGEVVLAGYDFGGWFDNSGLSGSAITEIETGTHVAQVFWAKWTPTVYNISYDLGAASGVTHSNTPATYTILGGIITLQDPTRTGYDFTGWWSASIGGVKILSFNSSDIENKKFWARWTPTEYNITYANWNFPGVTNPNSKGKYTIEETFTVSNLTGTRTGYTFGGWVEGTSIPLNSTGHKTFTAIWNANTYNIWYFDSIDDLMEGKDPIDDSSLTLTFKYDIGINLALQVPEAPEGYTFAGWHDFDGPITEILPDTLAGDIYLFAQWIPVGSGELGSIIYNYGDVEVSHNPNPSKFTPNERLDLQDLDNTKDYKFLGWYNAPTGGEKVTYILETEASEITLYARWEKKSGFNIFDFVKNQDLYFLIGIIIFLFLLILLIIIFTQRDRKPKKIKHIQTPIPQN